MIVLGIETSCDECAAAIVQDGKHIVSEVVASQIDDHRPYYGVVPEIASRRHVETIGDVVGQALQDAKLDAAAKHRTTKNCSCVSVMSAGVHHTSVLGCERNLELLADRKRIHVGAHGDRFAGTGSV